MSNKYTSPNVSIVGAPGTMYNEVTTFNNNHYNHAIRSNATGINANTNQIVGPVVNVKKGRKVTKKK